MVLLTIDVPDNMILLSDFDKWHYVLGGYAIADDQDKEYSNEEILNSWNKIFDIDNEANNSEIGLSIQATMWQIKREWVKKVEHFISR